MRTCEQWRLHCTSQWGWQTLLSEHVCCVTIAFKMTEQVEQRICIKFCMNLVAMGNWWLAASSWQHACSCITSHAEFFGETSNPPGDSDPLQPRFCALWLLAFPKTKITFEREEISDHHWDIGKYDGQLIAIGKTVWGPKVPGLKGSEASLSYVQCFLYLVSSSINASIFHITWLDTFYTDLIYHKNST